MQNSCAEKTVVYAGFWVRFAAFLIDSLVVGLLTLAARFALRAGFAVFGLFEVNPLDAEVLFTYTWRDIILYFLGAAYYVICTYCAGTTAGKWLFNLRVVPSETGDGEKLRLFDVVYRETIGKFLSGVIMNIGYIIAGIDSEKRALHDILCDTRVIYAKRVKVIPVQTRQQYTTYGGPAPQNPNPNPGGPGGSWSGPWTPPASGMPYTPAAPDLTEGQQVTEQQPPLNPQETPGAEGTSEKDGESRTAVQDTDSTGI